MMKGREGRKGEKREGLADGRIESMIAGGRKCSLSRISEIKSEGEELAIVIDRVIKAALGRQIGIKSRSPIRRKA